MRIDIKQLIFPIQIVKTNPEHVSSGEEVTIKASVDVKRNKIEGEETSIGIEMTVFLDKDESFNYPYDFEITVFSVFQLNKPVDKLTKKDKDFINMNTTQILIGAIRERLASLTSRAPWGDFVLNALSVPKSGEGKSKNL